MRYLIKNAKIISQGSAFHGKRKDVLIVNGTITTIGKNLTDAKATEIKSKDLHVSVGWLDVGTHLGEPGHEQRETTKTLCAAALAGGYTDIAPFPNAAPTIQTKSQLVNLQQEGQHYGVDIHPIGALSVDTKGENIAEYRDMSSAGAVAFSDGLHAVQKNGLLLRSLLYAKGGDALVIHHPTDHSLDNGNQVHEGESSIRMGIKGCPEIAEHLMVDRDLQLQQYTESKLCLHAISSKGAVDRVKKAKEKSSQIYATVAYLNLVATDEDMLDFDSNYKVSPVLRGKADQSALQRAVKGQVIDCICSNHVPYEPESKELEFSYAENGATGLETAYAAINTFAGDRLDTEDVVAALTTGPRTMLNIEHPSISEGATAKITCWDPTVEWTYTSATKKSKSSNNPYIGTSLSGKVLATINGKTVYTA